MVKEKKKNEIGIGKTIILMSIMIIVGLIVWLLTSKNETYISTDNVGTNYSALECISSKPVNPFFISETAENFTHSIKMLFADEHLKEMSYRYDGTYDTEMRAENAEAWLHADYNKYMVANELNPESLNPVFSVGDGKLIVSLYAETKKINSTVARLFFMNGKEFRQFDNLLLNDYKTIYEQKGFICETND